MKKKAIESVFVTGFLFTLSLAAFTGKIEKEVSFHTISETPVAGINLTQVICQRNALCRASVEAAETSVTAAEEPAAEQPEVRPETENSVPTETKEPVTEDHEETMIKESQADDGFIILEPSVDEDLQRMIYRIAKEYDLDYRFVMAVINKESHFNPNTISKTDDYGLMQLNKITHAGLTKALGITDFLDPEENVRGGCYILSNLYKTYQDYEKTLVAYNRGAGGAKKLFEQGITSIPYSEDIMTIYEDYKNR